MHALFAVCTRDRRGYRCRANVGVGSVGRDGGVGSHPSPMNETSLSSGGMRVGP